MAQRRGPRTQAGSARQLQQHGRSRWRWLAVLVGITVMAPLMYGAAVMAVGSISPSARLTIQSSLMGTIHAGLEAAVAVRDLAVPAYGMQPVDNELIAAALTAALRAHQGSNLSVLQNVLVGLLTEDSARLSDAVDQVLGHPMRSEVAIHDGVRSGYQSGARDTFGLSGWVRNAFGEGGQATLRPRGLATLGLLASTALGAVDRVGERLDAGFREETRLAAASRAAAHFSRGISLGLRTRLFSITNGSLGQVLSLGDTARATLPVSGSFDLNASALTAARGQITTDAALGDTVTFATLTGKADLSVRIVGLPDHALVGQTLAYELLVFNGGPSPARSLMISANAGAGARFEFVQTSDGVCSHTFSELTCRLRGFPAYATATVQVQSRFVPNGTIGQASLGVRVAASTRDLHPEDNFAQETVNLGTASDLMVAVATTSASPESGLLSFTVSVRNQGPSEATNVVVTDRLPGNTAVVRVEPGRAHCGVAAGTVTCTIDRLEAGSTTAIGLKVASAAPLRGAAWAGVLSASAAEQDPNSANNAMAAAEEARSPSGTNGSGPPAKAAPPKNPAPAAGGSSRANPAGQAKTKPQIPPWAIAVMGLVDMVLVTWFLERVRNRIGNRA